MKTLKSVIEQKIENATANKLEVAYCQSYKGQWFEPTCHWTLQGVLVDYKKQTFEPSEKQSFDVNGIINNSDNLLLPSYLIPNEIVGLENYSYSFCFPIWQPEIISYMQLLVLNVPIKPFKSFFFNFFKEIYPYSFFKEVNSDTGIEVTVFSNKYSSDNIITELKKASFSAYVLCIKLTVLSSKL